MFKELEVRLFKAADFDLTLLAAQLTELKALASRALTPVTVQELEQVDTAGNVCNLFLQLDGEIVVGWCMITISVFEDRGHLGPIAVKKEGGHTGYGSSLMQFALDYVKENHPELRRVDLSNRPDHDLESWYRKFGFIPRTEVEGDPTTVYRLSLR